MMKSFFEKLFLLALACCSTYGVWALGPSANTSPYPAHVKDQCANKSCAECKEALCGAQGVRGMKDDPNCRTKVEKAYGQDKCKATPTKPAPAKPTPAPAPAPAPAKTTTKTTKTTKKTSGNTTLSGLKKASEERVANAKKAIDAALAGLSDEEKKSLLAQCSK